MLCHLHMDGFFPQCTNLCSPGCIEQQKLHHSTPRTNHPGISSNILAREDRDGLIEAEINLEFQTGMTIFEQRSWPTTLLITHLQ